MMGIIDDAVQPDPIRPTCRYGHGDLEMVTVGQTAEYIAPYSRPLQGIGLTSRLVTIPVNGFSFHIFKCTKCSYLEFHDFVIGAQDASS